MPLIFNADRVREPLHVIVPFQNPWRWKSRVKHLHRALKHFHDSGATITLVELGFNRRDLMFADSGLDGTPTNCEVVGSKYKHKYIGLHSPSETWAKESLINIGVQSLPYDWQQVAWVDGDVHWARPNWVGECIQKLQHGGSSDIAFCQMFSHAVDLGPNYEVLPNTYPHAQGISYAQAWKDGTVKPTLTPTILADLERVGGDLKALLGDFMQLEEDVVGNYYGQDATKRVWPGLCWAATRKGFEAVGGLMDFAIWGGSDFATAKALAGDRQAIVREDLHTNYKALTMEWFDRCEKYVRRNILVMDGTILHHWHGRKVERGYVAKHALLAKYGFDPLRHLKRDSQGLNVMHDDGSESFVQMRESFRRIAKERNEDSIDTGLEGKSQGH